MPKDEPKITVKEAIKLPTAEEAKQVIEHAKRQNLQKFQREYVDLVKSTKWQFVAVPFITSDGRIGAEMRSVEYNNPN